MKPNSPVMASKRYCYFVPKYYSCNFHEHNDEMSSVAKYKEKEEKNVGIII
jgi:hypothetical protein